MIAAGNLTAGRGDGVRALTHLTHDTLQAGVHILERLQQLADFILALHCDLAAEITLRHRLRQLHCRLQRPRDGTRNQHGQSHTRGHGAQQQRDDPPAGSAIQIVARLIGGLGGLRIDLSQLINLSVNAENDLERITTQNLAGVVTEQLVRILHHLGRLLRIALQLLAHISQQRAFFIGLGVLGVILLVLQQLTPQLGHAFVILRHFLGRLRNHMLHGLRAVALQLVAHVLQGARSGQPLASQIGGRGIDALHLNQPVQARYRADQQDKHKRHQQLMSQLEIAKECHEGEG